MTESLSRLLLRLSEAGDPAVLWGRQAKPYLGQELERLLATGVLVEDAPATEWDVCASCECGHDSRLIQEINGRFIAACPYDRHSDTELVARDLRSFLIPMPALVREITAASGIKQEPTQVMPGVWHLGQTSTNRDIYIVPSIGRVLQPGLVAALRTVSRSLPITVLTPALPASEQLRFAEAEIHTVLLCNVIGSDDRAAAFAIDLARLEPTPRFVPRLVIVRSTKAATLDGESRMLSDQTFGLLTLLAERALTKDPYATPRDIEERIWGNAIHLLTRQARDVVRELRDALSVGTLEPAAIRGLVKHNRNRGWCLTLAAAEIDIRGDA
jgi:hypothetical protein